MKSIFNDLPLFPTQASTFAPRVDATLALLMILSAFFGLLIVVAILYFSVKYRKNSKADRTEPAHVSSLPFEIAWTAIPFALTIVLFVIGARGYFDTSRAPANAMDIYVIGKQWMWKLQHQNGKREINELHIPRGIPIRLVMTSQDVIHSFYVPEFRTKQDVLPGRYTSEWFQATKSGEYHLFCAEYCGTIHSGMIGKVIVMEPADFQKWLGGVAAQGGSMASRGEALFSKLGCATCHRSDSMARAPNLAGLFGSTVHLKGGGTTPANETYIRESILDPNAKLVDGYDAIMPTFKTQVTEDDINDLVAYIKTLKPAGADIVSNRTPANPQKVNRK